MRSVLFLLSSARAGGNSETLARLAAKGLDCPCIWHDLTTPTLPAFDDPRPKAPPAPEGALGVLAQAMFAATDLVFVAPVYWYALPAPAKLFLDHWSGWLDVAGMEFHARMAGKRVWLISARADPDPSVPESMQAMLHRTAGWMGMIWGGALHGVADAPGEIVLDHKATSQAADFLHIPA